VGDQCCKWTSSRIVRTSMCPVSVCLACVKRFGSYFPLGSKEDDMSRQVIFSPKPHNRVGKGLYLISVRANLTSLLHAWRCLSVPCYHLHDS
jgi:hypothetical protein